MGFLDIYLWIIKQEMKWNKCGILVGKWHISSLSMVHELENLS